MGRHIHEFYSAFSDETSKGSFHSVISLNEEPNIAWEDLVKKVPLLSKGWYELSHLPVDDRLEFVCNHWLMSLPFQIGLKDALIRFFNRLDDIWVYIFQKKYDDPFLVELVYSLKGEMGFFRGAQSAGENSINALQQAFPKTVFPVDYLNFLKIHNGFSKATDMSGIIPSHCMKETYINFQEMLANQEKLLLTTNDFPVEPKLLIPFYESFGMPFFQCFYEDWYPEQEMGNVYYSKETHTISDLKKVSCGPESLAFATFIDWLIFYLEGIE